MLYACGATLYPVDKSVGRPEINIDGARLPLVPTTFRRASKLRVRVTVDGARKDLALVSGVVPNIANIIVEMRSVADGLEFIRRDGTSAGKIYIAGSV